MSMSTACMGVGGLLIACSGYDYCRAKNQNEKMRAVSFVLLGIATIAFGYVFFPENGAFDKPQDSLGILRSSYGDVSPAGSYDLGSEQCDLMSIPDNKITCEVGIKMLSTVPRESTMYKLIQKLRERMDFTSCRDFLPWKNSFYAPIRSIERINLSDMKRSMMWGFDPFGRFYFAKTGISEIFGAEAVAVHQICPQNFEDFVSFDELVGIDFS